jgi:alkanesulfonate monooxygenase SsuD/methylene tetrahydromethanopterin reductase-like flavin-dependent oxidoreductase (luciferase family)
MNDQVAWMRKVWAGEEPEPGSGTAGPRPVQPGGPELLVGGFAPKALQRASAWANGLTTFSHRPDLAKIETDFQVTRQAWRDAGRGEPRLVASFCFALGPHAEEGRQRYVESHYAHLGPDGQAKIAANMDTISEQRVREVLRALEDLGADEVVPVPMIPELAQVDRLADLVA